MTNEIIIDGVNVAECNHRVLNSAFDCFAYTLGVCKGQDCYFKQLQRLKQENEVLKRKVKNETKRNK